MKRINLVEVTLVVACYLLAGGPMLRADSLTISLTEANQTVVEGTTAVVFTATVSNPSPTADTLYLNGDSSSTNSLLITLDDSPYLTNAPFSLDPGVSSGSFEIFDINLDPSLGPGLYTGTFSILGGADGGAGTAFDDLGDVNFSVDVTAPVSAPEPAVLLLVGTGLIGLGFLRRKLSLSR